MSIKEIQFIDIPKFADKNGTLIKVESQIETNFIIKRFFQIIASKGDIRGYHAHLKYSQLMFCSLGKIELHCEDGFEKKMFVLDEPTIGILLPPLIWSHQKYLEDNSILNVLSDGEYNEDEYIREYDQYLKILKK
tara:strand:+ start:141 stop:545 length:405 start_codon:yes stop_codon:yes gene_type:complete